MLLREERKSRFAALLDLESQKMVRAERFRVYSKRHMAAVRSMLESQSERSKTYALTKKDTPIADAAVARRQ
jgi:hypothetical protein